MDFAILICQRRFMTVTIQANGYRGALKAVLESLPKKEAEGKRG